MRTRRLLAATVGAVALAWPVGVALAGQRPSHALVVDAGRPLRLSLDRRTRIRRVGQPVTATLVEDVYAYDRVVIPEGTKVIGRVARLEGIPPAARAAAMLGGEFTPNRLVGLQFDTVVLRDGLRVPIRTTVMPGTARPAREVAGAHDDGLVGHARRQVAEEARRAASIVTAPGILRRLNHYLVGRLPVHPQYLEAGWAVDAQLVEPVSFGVVERSVMAPEDVRPPPESILNARLLTGLTSASTLRGAPVKAVLTRPLLSAAHEVILPEGTVVSGKVTFVKSARNLRRNGQLRFLFGALEVPGRSADPQLASLFSADVGGGQHLEIDEEGGTKVTNPKSRFIAPALAGAAMIVPLDRTEISDEGLGSMTTEASVAGHGVKGLAGFGLLGAALAVVSRPAAVAFGAFGLARTVYVSLLGKGRDVVFPVNTSVQIQLSPGKSPTP